VAAAAQIILALERLGGAEAHLVATAGRLTASPGAPNVIPGHVEFTVDMRSPSDAVCHRAQRELLALLAAISRRRRIELKTLAYQEVPATALHVRITAAVSEAIDACGLKAQELSSSAGHDAMMMARLCPAGMVFLRYKDGISHSPAESVTAQDADISVCVLLETV
jgi:allantoate deiminase